jgi:energy-converting hydrogenase Eha subunit H
MIPVPLPNGDIDWTADLDFTGRFALVLARTGTLHVIDMTSRQVTGSLPALVPPMPTSGTVLTPFFAFAEGLAYMTSPGQGRVYELAISATGVPTIARTLNVGGTPERIVVLGVRENRSLQR